jgi:hypothetical protein
VEPVARLRGLCLDLPETAEKIAWGAPTWRVRDRMFALGWTEGDKVAAWLKAPDGVQEVLVGADPARFFRPPYFGPKGWIGVRLEDDAVDWDEVDRLVRRSWRMTAPKRLAARLPGPDG